MPVLGRKALRKGKDVVGIGVVRTERVWFAGCRRCFGAKNGPGSRHRFGSRLRPPKSAVRIHYNQLLERNANSRRVGDFDPLFVSFAEVSRASLCLHCI